MKQPKLTAAIYARVSTTDQRNAIQIKELKAYAKARNWRVYQVYEDQQSGASHDRPGLETLMSDARQRRFDVVLVWKLDRFGRSLLHLVQGVLELQSLGVRFVTTTQGIDTDQSNPMAQLLLHILGAFAEFERAMIRERIHAGMKAARARGVHCGRRPIVFNREYALEMSATGASERAIAAELAVSPATIHRLLAKNKTGAQ